MRCFTALSVLLCASLVLADVSLADDAGKPIAPEAVKLGRPIDFATDIEPILEQNCLACHNAGIAENGFALESLEDVLKGGKHGTALKPGEPDASLLYIVAARQKSQVDAMPPLPNEMEARSLTPKELGLLRQWISEGAKWGDASDAVAVNWSGVAPVIQSISAVAMDRHGTVAAAGRANRITLHDVHTGQLVDRLVDPALASSSEAGPTFGPHAAHRDIVQALAFHPDGNLIASGGYRSIKLWQRSDSLVRSTFDLPAVPTGLTVAADRTRAAMPTADGSVLVVDLTTGKTLHTLKGHTAAVTGLAFNGEATRLVTVAADKTVRLWDVTAGEEQLSLPLTQVPSAVLFSKDATTLHIAEDDNVVRSYLIPETADGFDGKPVKELKGHSARITTLVPDHRERDRLLTGSDDGTVRWWDATDGRMLRQFSLGGKVTATSFRSDGKFVVAMNDTGLGRLWDFANGRTIADLKTDLTRNRRLAEARADADVAGKMVNLAEAERKAAEQNLTDRTKGLEQAKTALDEARKKVPEAEKKANEANKKRDEAEAAFKKNEKDNNLKKKRDDAAKAATTATDELNRARTGVAAAERAITRAEQSLATAKTRLETATNTKSDAEATKKTADETVQAIGKEPAAKVSPVGIEYTPDGSVIAVIDAEGRLHKFDGATGTPIDTLPIPPGAVELSFLSDSDLLIPGGSKSVSVTGLSPEWSLLRVVGPTDPNDLKSSPFVDRVTALTFSRDGTLLAAGGGEPSRSGEILLFDVRSGDLVKQFDEPHSDVVTSLTFSRDGSQLLSGGTDKFVKLFDVSSGKLVRSYEGHTDYVLAVALSADGATLASGGADNSIKIWKTATGEQIKTVTNHSKQVTGLQFVGTKDEFVSSSGDKSVRFFRSSNGQNLVTLSDARDYLYGVAVTPDGQIAVTGGEAGLLRIYDVKAKRVRHQIPAEPTE